MKCFGKYRENALGCNFCDLIIKAKCYSKTKETMETKETKTKFEENTIVRCIAKWLSRFTEGNSYRIISRDFEHSKGYDYGIVNDAGLIDYFTQEEVEKNFTDKDIPNEVTYFSNVNEASDIKDNVNHPSHYTWLKDLCGVEPIDICKYLDFDLGNALKYILRAGHKKDISMTDGEKTIEDLKKAIFYINDKIEMLENEIKNKQ